MPNHYAQLFGGRRTLWVNYLFLVAIFALNFVGHPSLKHLLAAYLAFAALTAAFGGFQVTGHVLLGLSFVEGQARVLWNYHPAFRLAFDIVVAIALVHTFVVARGINFKELLALPLRLLALLHLTWYLVEFANPANVGTLAPLAATKIYVFPLLVFLMFRANTAVFTSDWVEGIARGAVALTVAEGALAIFQMQQGEAHMLRISGHYLAAMKTDVFIGKDFRPFGTTFLPGVVSVYLFLAAGFLLLRRRFDVKALVWVFVVVVFVSLTMLGSQVRSAMVKYALVLASAGVALMWASPVRTSRKLIYLVGVAVVLGVLAPLALSRLEKIELAGLEAGVGRWQDIQSVEDFQSKRVTPALALKVVWERLQRFPIGIGPGLTGAASSVSRDVMDRDPVYDKETFWGYDNLFLSLVIEFGYGAVFYLGLIFAVLWEVARAAHRARKEGDAFRTRVAVVACCQMAVVLLGNWGAIGLPYNPESFFFWFWAAIALNIQVSASEKTA